MIRPACVRFLSLHPPPSQPITSGSNIGEAQALNPVGTKAVSRKFVVTFRWISWATPGAERICENDSCICIRIDLGLRQSQDNLDVCTFLHRNTFFGVHSPDCGSTAVAGHDVADTAAQQR